MALGMVYACIILLLIKQQVCLLRGPHGIIIFNKKNHRFLGA
jgi:hypothetical protein